MISSSPFTIRCPSAAARSSPTRASILLTARPPETPVAIARNLGRDGERVAITTLAALDPAQVDMLSLVLVGSSTTRRVSRPDGGNGSIRRGDMKRSRTRAAPKDDAA